MLLLAVACNTDAVSRLWSIVWLHAMWRVLARVTHLLNLYGFHERIFIIKHLVKLPVLLSKSIYIPHTSSSHVRSTDLALPVLRHTPLLLPSHEPTADGEEYRVYRAPRDQDSKVKTNARM